MHPRNRRALLAIALCVVTLTLRQGASAQTTPPVASPSAMGPNGMSMSEWQGVSCLWAGVLGSAAVFYYSDVLTVAATGSTNPLLLVPLVATGFLGGCSAGANGSPGLTWLYRHM
ncbi:MAG TPA: hypothetical protein VIY55_00915 [Acetobacteraceae bacterium]